MSTETQQALQQLPNVSTDADILSRPRYTLWRDTVRRLLRNEVATAAGIYIILITLAAIFAGLVTPYTQTQTDFANTRVGPTTEHYFGTDHLGRDVFTRIIYGGRVSLGVAFVGSLTALVIGVTYGAIAGYLGGLVDDLMMRFVDLMFGFPFLLFVILMMLVVRPSAPAGLKLAVMFLALGAISWLNVARLVRGQFLSLREKEFVEAARATGTTPGRIVLRHLLPNSIGPVVVWLTLQIPNLILLESTLSFIGLGAGSEAPSWGQMLWDGRQAMRTLPHLTIFPGLAITVTMLAFNFFGDGLRDALDPTLRGRE
jgi:oligopeptide transport system permease protein